MPIRHFILIPFLCATAASALPTGNPHGLKPTTICDTCHEATPTTFPSESTCHVLPQAQAFNNDGAHMCSGCHDNEEDHRIDILINFPIPADLPLDRNDI